jgi:glycosyltransferase involved in cell wall biosynthesis
VKVGLTLHDSWLLTGHCAGPGECERWKTGCGNCPDLALPRPIQRDASACNWQVKQEILARCALSVVTPSRYLMSRVRESLVHQAVVSYRVIPNGTDLSRFRPGAQSEARRSLGLPDQARIVLLIAHNPFKDYGTMEAALKRIRPQEGVPLLFICLGKTAQEKAVGQGRMIYPGFILDESQMIRYYQASDVYVHAANDESFGKTISEAMACRIPAVATDVGGIPEQMIDAHTGFLVPRKGVEAMAARTQLLLDREDLRRQIGANALRHVQDHFEIGKMIRAYMSWYEEMLADTSNPFSRRPKTGDIVQ